MRRARFLSGAVLSAALLTAAIPALPVLAEEGEGRGGSSFPNVLVTLTISKAGGGEGGTADRVYKFIGQDGSDAKMLIGWRTPIPTVSAARESEGKPSMTSFVYQNVGVSASLRIRVLDGGRISLDGGIEITGAREGTATDSTGQKLPLIGTFQQTLRAVVMEGKRLRVAEGPDPEGGRVSLDIEAAVQR